MNPTAFLTANWLVLVLAAVVIVFGVGRISRLIIFDSFPPVVALRNWWDEKVPDPNPWNKLGHCPWCLTPWLMLIAIGVFVIGWFVLWVAIVWWVVLGWLALSYATSIVIAYDERD